MNVINGYDTSKTTLMAMDFKSKDAILWDDFVSQIDSESQSCFSSQVLNALEHQGFINFSAMLIVKDDGHITVVGIFPLFLRKSPLFGDYLISTPAFNYGGFRAAPGFEEAAESEFLKWTMHAYKTSNAKRVEIRSPFPISSFASVYELDTHKSNLLLAIPEDLKMLGDGNAKSRSRLRSQCGRAAREAETKNAALLFETTLNNNIATEKLLKDFHNVYSERMRDLGTPCLGLSWFKELFSKSQGKAVVVVAYWENIPVSAGFLLLGSNGWASIPWAASVHEITCNKEKINIQKISMNSWFYLQVISFCKSVGCSHFDFGRSTNNEGTYDFKMQWGSQPKACYWYTYTDRKKDTSKLRADNPKFQLMISAWKKLPLSVARFIGPWISRQLP